MTEERQMSMIEQRRGSSGPADYPVGGIQSRHNMTTLAILERFDLPASRRRRICFQVRDRDLQ